jgi:amino acid permease
MEGEAAGCLRPVSRGNDLGDESIYVTVSTFLKTSLSGRCELVMNALFLLWVSIKKRLLPKAGAQTGHSIGYWGGVCLLANNITGPGMVLIPSVFAQSGWLFPTVLFVVTGSLSAISVLYLAKSLTLIPGNEKLQKRTEFAPLIKMLFPAWLYRITFFGLLFLLQITNIGSIVISAQTMDYTAMTIGGKTCAITLYSGTWATSSAPLSGTYDAGDNSAVHPVFQCIVSSSNTSSTQDSVFGGDYVLSLGYIIVAIIVIPMGIFNLEDNIWVQKGGFLGLVFCVFAWLAQFLFVSGIDTSLTPAVGEYSSWGSSISLIVFNFGFTLTVPSWINEKEPGTSTSSSVWVSVIISGHPLSPLIPPF